MAKQSDNGIPAPTPFSYLGRSEETHISLKEGVDFPTLAGFSQVKNEVLTLMKCQLSPPPHYCKIVDRTSSLLLQG